MSNSILAAAQRSESQRPKVRAEVKRSQFIARRGVTMLVLALGSSIAHPKPSWAGDEPPAGAVPTTSRFVAGSRETLKRLRVQMVSLGTKALEGIDNGDPSDGDVPEQSLRVESAKAAYQRALLGREAAEIALKEYQEGLFKQEKKSCDTEIELAQAELESAGRAIEPARERFAKIKEASSGSVADLVAVWQFENGEVVAQLKQKKAQFALEQANSKLKVLMEYEYPKRVKALRSAVEKSRSDELARQATVRLEELKLKKMQNPAKSQARITEDRKRILGLLDRAIPLEEQLSARLDPIKQDSPPGDALRNEIADLAGKLRGIVEQAQSVEDAAALARLKSRIQRAADW